MAVVKAAYRGIIRENRGIPMLATVLFIIGTIRRALRKTGRGMFIVADALDEAIGQSDAARRKYPFAD
jgi:hypothetical protein